MKTVAWLMMVWGFSLNAMAEFFSYDERLQTQNILRPLPLNPLKGLNKRVVELGQALFFDPRLSHNGEFSCNSCHQLHQGGDDGLRRSRTIGGGDDPMNTPTVFNSGFNFRQSWRGAFRSLEEQATDVLSNPLHMNHSVSKTLSQVGKVLEYRKQFKKNFPKQGLTEENLLFTIAEFERSLITPNARFDQYLRGDKSALTTNELEGYQLFKTHGCVACHHGVNLGGTLYQKIGVFEDYFTLTKKTITKADWGRYNVTGDPEDMFVFRVPSLRNVAVTSPYFHDGGIASLTEAVRFMVKGQLGIDLPVRQIDSLVAFLHTLTGEYQGRLLEDVVIEEEK